MRALIVGLGLIGGSLAKAFKKYQIASELAVFDPNIASCNQAVADGVANEICQDLTKILQYQVIAIACPLGAFANIAPIVFKNASETALIFDVGSLKNFAELDFKSIKPNFNSSIFNNPPQNFIPAHPIAGSHLTGYQNSDADLFIDKNFVVCLNENPTELQKKFAEQLKQIITKIGSKPVELPPEDHDYIYGAISHLPQYLSFYSCQINNINFFQINQLSCPYLQRCFRLNYSDKHLWEEIFLLNNKLLHDSFNVWHNNFCNILQKLCVSSNPYQAICQFITEYKAITPSPATLADIKQNSKEIILRLILVIAYLQMPKIEDYKKYAGKGFVDFTIIINIISIIDEKTFNQLFNNNIDVLKLLLKNKKLMPFSLNNNILPKI